MYSLTPPPLPFRSLPAVLSSTSLVSSSDLPSYFLRPRQWVRRRKPVRPSRQHKVSVLFVHFFRDSSHKNLIEGARPMDESARLGNRIQLHSLTDSDVDVHMCFSSLTTLRFLWISLQIIIKFLPTHAMQVEEKQFAWKFRVSDV